jgi:hypothetical protein
MTSIWMGDHLMFLFRWLTFNLATSIKAHCLRHILSPKVTRQDTNHTQRWLNPVTRWELIKRAIVTETGKKLNKLSKITNGGEINLQKNLISSYGVPKVSYKLQILQNHNLQRSKFNNCTLYNDYKIQNYLVSDSERTWHFAKVMTFWRNITKGNLLKTLMAILK